MESPLIKTSRLRDEYLPNLLVVVCMILSGWIGARAVDFGHHWDELKLVKSAQKTVEDGKLLPGWYNYPSFCHWVCSASLYSFKLEKKFLDGDTKDTFQLKGHLTGKSNKDTWSIQRRQRRWFVWLSLLGIWGAFRLGRELWKSAWIGALAAAFLAFNFEWGYHARWAAPDLPMAAFALLSLAASLRYYRTGKWSALLWAAALGGLAFATKYPVGLILLPPLLAMGLRERETLGPIRSWWTPENRKKWLWVIGLFFGVFLFITPGIFLDSAKFFADLRYESAHYGGGHRGHSVGRVFAHLWWMSVYYFGEGFHSVRPISVLMGLFGLGGVAALVRKSPRLALIGLLFPLTYLLFFAFQKVMIVRNYQVLLAFGTVFAAGGMGALLRWLYEKKMGKLTAGLGLLLILTLAGSLLLQNHAASESIRNKSDFFLDFRRLEAFMVGHPEQTFLLANKTEAIWNNWMQKPVPFNSVRTAPVPGRGGEPWVVFFSTEPKDAPICYNVANRPGILKAMFGPQDINWAYYPSWTNARLIVMEWEDAKDLGLTFGGKIEKAYLRR